MIDWVSLASTGLAFFILAASPGPATISNAAIAMSYGRRTSLIFGAGLSCGLISWGLVAATGMGAVLQGSMYLLSVLKILGGIYLLWLAFQSGRSALQPDTKATVVGEEKRWFLRGLILNISNPKSVIAWMAALSIGLNSTSSISAFVAATGVCIVVGFITNALYSILFSIKGVMLGYQRFGRTVDGAVAIIFTVAGLSLLRSALYD